MIAVLSPETTGMHFSAPPSIDASIPAILSTLMNILEARDPYTKMHSAHVAGYAALIGQILGLPQPAIEHLRRAGVLHDIGKIGVRDTILLKPGPLDEEETIIMRQHPVASAQMILPIFPELAWPVLHHHEAYDGSGYPCGLRGEAIPFEARVLAVADAFDAMTTDRPHRKRRSVSEARAILLEGRGAAWDPAIVDAFCSIERTGL